MSSMSFLAPLGLSQYAAALDERGITGVEELAEKTAKELAKMGLKAGHARKLYRHVQLFVATSPVLVVEGFPTALKGFPAAPTGFPVPPKGNLPLLIRAPPSVAGQALVAAEKEHAHTFNVPGIVGACHGRHVEMRVGPAAKGALWEADGPEGGGQVVRLCRGNKLLLLDCAGGTHACQRGTAVNIHATVEHPEWAQTFAFDEGGLLCPVNPANARCATLCLGVGAGNCVELVERSDGARRLVFGGALVEGLLRSAADAAAALPPPIAPGSDARVLLITSPPCDWLGVDARKALVVAGGVHAHTFSVPGVGACHGRHTRLRVGPARDAARFVFDGPQSAMALRLADDRLLLLDCAGGTRVAAAGTNVNMHATVEHPEWAQTFAFARDGTLGPVDRSNARCANLCLGVEKGAHGEGLVVLVPRSDGARRLVFGGGAAFAAVQAELAAERAAAIEAQRALRGEAVARCDGEMRAALQRDGYAALPGAIAPELVRAARREINRELGSASGGSDAFKAKTFAHHPAIVDLIKVSFLLPLHLRESCSQFDSLPLTYLTIPGTLLLDGVAADAVGVSVLLCTVTFYANLAHSLTRSP